MERKYKDTSNRVHQIDDQFLSLLPVGCTEITDAEATTLLSPTTAQIRESFVASAQVALDKTDMVAIRCLKAGVAFPPDWQTYVANLRAIVNGSDVVSTSLPTQPVYPVGT